MTMIRGQVLELYKKLLRYSEDLKFTDRKYFVQRIKKEFLDNKSLTNDTEIEFHYKKGLAVLKYKRIV